MRSSLSRTTEAPRHRDNQTNVGRASTARPARRRAAPYVMMICLLGVIALDAQGRGGSPPSTARAMAPIDLTGYWTAVVTEDWHVRMLTAPRGDFGVGEPGVIENPGVGRLGLGPNPAARSNIPYNEVGAQA